MSYQNSIDAPLGKTVSYRSTYDPSLLCPIPREHTRNAAGIRTDRTSWFGEDIWNLYELSWIDKRGKPQVAIGEMYVPSDSPCLVESKSMKLYCNSLNMTEFSSLQEVRETIAQDLQNVVGTAVGVTIIPPERFPTLSLQEPEGFCLEELPVGDFSYTVNPALLSCGERTVSETLFSRVFRSCCPVTGQPDWATITITYEGRIISHDNLLRYLVSYRDHSGFHETCIEKIFLDISNRCRPNMLTVSARFTRRGGIDINPVRSSKPITSHNCRDPRQ